MRTGARCRASSLYRPRLCVLSAQERACQTRGDVASFSVYCRTISGENSNLASGYNGLGDREEAGITECSIRGLNGLGSFMTAVLPRLSPA